MKLEESNQSVFTILTMSKKALVPSASFPLSSVAAFRRGFSHKKMFIPRRKWSSRPAAIPKAYGTIAQLLGSSLRCRIPYQSRVSAVFRGDKGIFDGLVDCGEEEGG